MSDENGWNWTTIAAAHAPQRAEGFAGEASLPDQFPTISLALGLPDVVVRAKADDSRVLVVDVRDQQVRTFGKTTRRERDGSWVLDGRDGEARIELAAAQLALRIANEAVAVGRRAPSSADQALAAWTPDVTVLEAPPVKEWLDSWPHQSWFATEVLRLSALADTVSRASAAGAFVRLWLPPRGSVVREALIERASPSELALQWFAKQPDASRAEVTPAILRAVSILHDDLEVIDSATFDLRSELVRAWLVRRDDLANVEALIQTTSPAVEDSLESLTREIAARGESLRGQRFPNDERLVAARLTDDQAWWAHA